MLFGIRVRVIVLTVPESTNRANPTNVKVPATVRSLAPRGYKIFEAEFQFFK